MRERTRNRKEITFNRRILALLVLPILLLSLGISSSAHLTDSVNTKYKLYVMGGCSLVISSQKVLCCDHGWDCGCGCDWDSGCDLSYTVDTSSITISTDTAHSGMSIWVGLRIDNEGSLPLNFSGASYSWSLLPGGITVSIHEYFYGPWKTNWPHEVWADVNIHDLEEHGAPAGNVLPPITLETPGGKKKMILWVHIELGCPPDTFPFEITISLPCPTTGQQVTTSSYTWGRP